MAARPGSPSRWLGAVSALALGTACNDDDQCKGASFDPPPEPEPSPSAPPTVIAGEWIGGGVLELSFSKPLSSTGDLDPDRFAILSWDAIAYGSGFSNSCYLSTNYREMGPGYYYYSGGRSVAAAWIGPEEDTLLRLRLANSAAQCRISSNSLGSGVMLAYTDATNAAAGNKLLGEDGIAVPDIGPLWAIQRLDNCFGDSYYCSVNYGFASGHLSQLTSLVQIPCP